MKNRFTKGITCMIAFALILVMILAGCGKSATSEESVPVEEAMESGLDEFVSAELVTLVPDKVYLQVEGTYPDLVDPIHEVINALRVGDTDVDLSEYSLSQVEMDRVISSVRVSYPPSVTVAINVNGSNIEIEYVDKEKTGEDIRAFESEIDSVLTTIISENNTDSAKAKAAYDYILNNFEYKSEGKSITNQEFERCLPQFMNEFNNRQMSFYNSNFLYIYLINQLDLLAEGNVAYTRFIGSDNEAVNTEFDGATRWVWTTIMVPEKNTGIPEIRFYHTDIAMDMVAKGGLDNVDYQPLYFGMSDDTRYIEWEKGAATIYTYIGTAANARTHESIEDLVVEYE